MDVFPWRRDKLCKGLEEAWEIPTAKFCVAGVGWEPGDDRGQHETDHELSYTCS